VTEHIARVDSLDTYDAKTAAAAGVTHVRDGRGLFEVRAGTYANRPHFRYIGTLP